MPEHSTPSATTKSVLQAFTGLSNDEQEILDNADRFAKAELHPLAQRMDDEEWWPEEAMPRLAQVASIQPAIVRIRFDVMSPPSEPCPRPGNGLLLQATASTYDASAAESARTERERCIPAQGCAGSHAGPTLVPCGPMVPRTPHRLRMRN